MKIRVLFGSQGWLAQFHWEISSVWQRLESFFGFQAGLLGLSDKLFFVMLGFLFFPTYKLSIFEINIVLRMYARFVLDEVWRELGYAVKPREVVEIYIHTYIYIYVKLKSLETCMLFNRLTSMVDYFVIFWYRREKPKETWRNIHIGLDSLLSNSHFLQNCLCTWQKNNFSLDPWMYECPTKMITRWNFILSFADLLHFLRAQQKNYFAVTMYNSLQNSLFASLSYTPVLLSLYSHQTVHFHFFSLP